ncbi:MAG TPA: RHS domain-containing protein [Propionibacteriaceae bacterium]|nr:RHS domain-containing protein [Propionibacteriaceae bacterium]
MLERHATFHSYDERGRLLRTYGPVNLDAPGANDVAPVEERTYWADGETSARQARLHEIRQYAFPAAEPLVTTYDYDLYGVSSVVGPDRVRTLITKDGRGRPRFVTTSDGAGTLQATTETRYYDGEVPRLRILPGGAADRYSYDGKGRLAKVEHLSSDPEAPGATPTLSYAENFAYDQAGNRVYGDRCDAQGRVTWRQDRAFDVQHHVVWESNPNVPAAARTWTYSPAGWLTSRLDEEGRQTSFTPDPLNRIKKVTRGGVNAAGSPVSVDVASYAYGRNRDVLDQVVDGAGRATSYAYDDFGRAERVTSPSIGGSGIQFVYDARGNVLTRQDAATQAAYAYDGLDRLVRLNAQNVVDGSTITYELRYDENGARGRLTSVLDPVHTMTYLYDSLGRLEREVLTVTGVSVPLTTIYGYDAKGALSSVTYPAGLVVQYDRDAATGQVVAVRNAGTGAPWASGIVRAPGGPVTGLTFGNGMTLSQTFDLRYQPTAVQSGPLLLTLQPTPGGDVGVVRDRSGDLGCTRAVDRSLRYDFLDRLVGWSDAAQGGVGVCPAEGLGAGGSSYEYVAGTDLLSQARIPDGAGLLAYAFGYDAQRNVSAIWGYDATGTSVTAAVCLRHDALGRLSLVGATNTAAAPGGTACVSDTEVRGPLARFRYDASNRRVARQVAGQWTYVVSDASGKPLAELAMTGDPATPWTKVRDYVWLDQTLLAQVEYGATTATYYAHVDHLGTPRALTSESGQLVWSTFQRPYGEVGEKTVPDAVTGQTVVTNLRLPGQYDERLLASVGLQGPYYNWHRWYLPSVGRYLELDPIALRGEFNTEFGVDWHNYANGNPLRYTDAEGLLSYDACLMRCIEKNRLDYWQVIPFSALPKRLLPPFRVPYPSQPLTTLPSVAQHYLPDFFGNGLRTFGRWVSPVATVGLVFEGFYDIGTIGNCAVTCGLDGPKPTGNACH